MATLICGSLAYDNIMTFEGRFREHILPEQVHILNVSFLVPTMRREFGGCAGNIAYALHLLGGDARIMATLGGADAQPYIDRLDHLGLSKAHVRVLPDTWSAQAWSSTSSNSRRQASRLSLIRVRVYRSSMVRLCAAPLNLRLT